MTQFKFEKEKADLICEMLRKEAKKRKVCTYGKRYSEDHVNGYKVKLYNVNDSFEEDYKKVINHIEELGGVWWFNKSKGVIAHYHLYGCGFLRSFNFKFEY